MGKITTKISQIGRFSYSLYIVHMPILVLIASLWLRYKGNLPHHPGLVFGGSICAGIAGWGIAYFIEHPVERFRLKISEKLGL